MAKTASLSAAVFAALCLQLSCAGASGVDRAWVSGHGTDAAGCGSPASPCRSLQYVHDNIIVAGGEIDVLDPAGYGAVTISKALSIVNDGVGTAGVQAGSGNAITVSAGPTDVVYLRGLNIDGLRTATNGIQFNSGATLVIDNCVIRHFASDGILMQPASGTTTLSLTNSSASDNTFNGLLIAPTGSGVLKGRVANDEFSRNDNGLFIAGDSTTGFAATNVLISDSSANDNASDAYAVSGGATMTLTRSISTGNFNGIGQYNGSNNHGGVLQSYGDNRFVGNVQLNAPDVVLLSGN